MSPSGGSFLTGLVPINITAQDNVGVTRVELLLDGVVIGTDNAAPWHFDWNTDLLDDGQRSLTARAYDQAGNIGSSSVLSVMVRHPFKLSFRNSTYTDITLTVGGQPTVTLHVGTVLTYTYPGKPSSVAFTGSTSGKTNQGSLVGLLMGWNDTYWSGSVRDDTVDLVIHGTYFFIKMKNCGSTINDFYVNVGTVAQTRDLISIPGDCVVRSLGYYNAYTNTEVQAYHTGGYSYWIQGVHFTLPFTDNQSVTLLDTYAGLVTLSTPDSRAGNPSGETLPQAVDLTAWLSHARPASKRFVARPMLQ